MPSARSWRGLLLAAALLAAAGRASSLRDRVETGATLEAVNDEAM